MRLLVVGGLLLALAFPVSGQNLDFSQLLSGKETPPTLKLNELTSEWRSLTVTMARPLDLPPKSDSLQPQLSKGNENAPILGYTRGLTCSLNGITYLVVYCPESKGLNLEAMMALTDQKMNNKPGADKTRAPESFEAVLDLISPKLTADTRLAVTLVDIKKIAQNG